MRAQTSAEFMIIAAALLAVVGLVLVFTFQTSLDFSLSQESLNADAILETVKNKMDTAYLEGNGFSTNLTLPPDISGANYSLAISGRLLVLNSTFSSYTTSFLTSNITGSLRKGVNTLTNINGTVVIL